MKRPLSITLYAGVLALIAAQTLFVAAYIDHERTIYFWDHAMYFNMARQLYELFTRDFGSGWALFQQSLANNYNLIFALPSLLSFDWFGAERIVFILTNFLIFFLAYEVAIAFLLRKALNVPWSIALILSLVSAALIPPLWLPLLEGYPDSGAAACLVFAAGLAIGGVGRSRFVLRALGVGILLGFAILLRRHFIYAALALLIALGGLAVWDLRRVRKNRRQELSRVIAYFAICGAGLIASLGLIAPDFLRSALTTDYGALYVSYRRLPYVFLRFVLGGFGWGLMLAAASGLILLARQNEAGRRLASFAALYTVIWLFIWCAGPDQMGHHYILHALPLFVSVGIAGWFLYLGKHPNRFKYAFGTVLALGLAINSGWALWASPTGVWPNDNGSPGLLSAPRPPVIRPDYNEWQRLAVYLRQTTRPEERIMMVGSSFVFNQDLLRSVYTDILEAPEAFGRFVRAPEIDHEEPAPFDAFATASIYLVPSPPQYHLDPKGQRVVMSAAAQFPPPPERAGMFRKDNAEFHLADDVTVNIWRRDAWTPTALYAALVQIRDSGPQDKSFLQDWAAIKLPLQAQIRTNEQNYSFANGFFDKTHRNLDLFFDYPLQKGNSRLAFAVRSNCADPRFRLKILTGGGHVQTSKDFAPLVPTGEIFQPFSVPENAGGDHFLELDLFVAPPALCQMELHNLRVEKEP